jgi:hypothetical protein
VLFPQFLYARLRHPRRLRPADLWRGLRSLRAAPWRQRPLLLHYLRRVWWYASSAPQAARDPAAVGEVVVRK